MWFGVAPITDTKKGMMCLKEIEIRAQNMITILGTIVNITNWGDLYDDHLMNTKTFTLITSKIFIRAPIFLRKVAMALIWIR